MRKLYVLAFAYLAMTLAFLGQGDASNPEMSHGVATTGTTPLPTGASGWFLSMKPYCNVVEVETRMRWNPAPDTSEGAAFEAACYALAGRVDTARDIIEALPEDEQWRAAGVVFNVGHPVADAGDDLSASEIMEMVVEFWPNHYMALYHAGAARFGLGHHDLAAPYLRRFLDEYGMEDGWTVAAADMLGEIENR